MMRSVRPPWLTSVIAALCLGCGASEPVVQRSTLPSTGSPSTHADETPVARTRSGPPIAPRIQAEARFVNDELEADIFGKQLLESGTVAVELSVALREGDDPISLRRDGINAVFLDGISVTSIDSHSTQELVKTFARLVPFGTADDVLHLTVAGEKLEGLVFFRSPSMPRATPETLTMELRDDRSGHVELLSLRIRSARPMPDD